MTDGLGLDKAARLEAKREEEADDQRPQPLNPPFPFQAEPFDPEFFGLTADPEPLR
jgi:hypothetical protein